MLLLYRYTSIVPVAWQLCNTEKKVVVHYHEKIFDK